MGGDDETGGSRSAARRSTSGQITAGLRGLAEAGWRRRQRGWWYEEYEPPPAPLDAARHATSLPVPRRPLRTLVGIPEQTAGRLLNRYLGDLGARRSDVIARTDPVWAAISGRLSTPGEPQWIYEDEGVKYAEAGARVEDSCAFRLQDWLQAHSALRRYTRLAGMIQRGWRGWADDDLWALDAYLCTVSAGAIRRIAELSFGWSDQIWATHADWVAELRRLADDLDQLVAHLDEHGTFHGAEDVYDRAAATVRLAFGHLRVD